MDRPITLPWWRRTRNWRLGTAVAIAIGGALVVRIGLHSADRTVRMPLANVTTARVERGVFHDFVPLRATVVPLETIYLDAAEGGRVDRILAQAGDDVAQGQPLIELSNTELELDVLEREGRLIESITQLQAYQTQLEQNRVANQKALTQIDYNIIRLQRALERRATLASSGLVPREEKDTLQDELDYDRKLRPMQSESNDKQEALRVRQMPGIESQLVKLQEDLNITHGKLDSLVVRAPVSGRLTSLDLKIGQNRNRGERLAQITPDSGNKLSAEVDEYYLQRIRVGQGATVDVDGRSLQIRVSRVYPQVKNGTFTVDLNFTGRGPQGLLPGQAVQGQLSLGADRPALLLPAGAFLERTGGDWVFVLGKDGREARRRAVKLGRRNAKELEVLSGLAAGEGVIISDYSGLERVDRVDLEK